MAYAKFSPAQITLLKAARNLTDADTAKELRNQMFMAAKIAANIPAEHKVKAEIDDTSSPVYAVLIRKTTGQPYLLGATTSQTAQPIAPPPPPARWFAISSDAVESLIGDTINDFEFSDGGNLHGESSQFLVHGTTFAVVDSIGGSSELYIKLEEADF